MAELVPGAAPLNRDGVLRQKQPDYYLLRLKAIAGDLTATQLACIALVAERYGKGVVHLSTRQGVEIHHVHKDDLEGARLVLQTAGVQMGASGNRVRVIVACPGNATCKWGAIETKKIATELDTRFFNLEAPYKFKMAVTGCANNCTKANENDIGVRGATEPKWISTLCTDCKSCVKFCPAKAIERLGEGSGADGCRYNVDRDICINCSICTKQCPSKAWITARQGYTLFIGGTMGKTPRFATMLKRIVESEEEIYDLVEKALTCYRTHGRKKERFGLMIDRIGIDKVRAEILGES
ncbi:MAG: 4Fe-4S binding protein [Chlorobium sp.]